MGWFRVARGCLAPGLLLLAACSDPSLPQAGEGEERPNVVVVVLDAARADHFGVYGYGRDTTPRADVFAGRATRYLHVRSEASYTFLSTGSLFTGASPSETGLGARSGGRVPASMKLLAERAQDAGYRTFGYSENPYVTPYFGLAQGFADFDEAYPTDDLKAGREASTEIDSSARLGDMLTRALAEDARPFFLYAHLLRPHNPYQPPAAWVSRFGGSGADPEIGSTGHLLEMGRRGPPFDPALIERLTALYDANLAYGDALFGELLDRIAAAGYEGRTIVVLTADHGEGFGEEGALLHSTRLDDARLWVPLLIHVPGFDARVAEGAIQLADLGRGLGRVLEGGEPGLLTRLETSRDPGRPLVSWTNAATGQMAAWQDGRRLVVDARSGGIVRYERGDSGAPSRSAPAGIALDDAGRALREALDAELAEWTGRSARVADPGSIDPVRRRQLEALGYVDP